MVVTIFIRCGSTERQRILERTNEGRLELKIKGFNLVVKPSIDRERLRSLYKSGVGATDIAKK